MSFIYERPVDPSFGEFTDGLTANGIATLGEIAGAAYDSMLYVDNTFASEEVMQEALERRLDAVERATGRRFDNPYDLQTRDFANTEIGFERYDLAGGIEDLQGQLVGLQKEFPNLSHIIRAEVPIADDAMEIGRKADERLGRFMASRAGWGKWGAVLAGGAPAALQDPVQFMTLGLGAAPSAARTVGGRILQVSAQEFVINAAVEAAMQPAVQAHRKALKIDSGLDEAIRNIALAGGFGAIFGAGVQGAGEALSAMLRSSGAGDLPANVRQALDGDLASISEVLEPIRDSLPAEVRGALDTLSIEPQLNRSAGASAMPAMDDPNLGRAAAAMQRGERPAFIADTAQIYRLADELVAPPEAYQAAGAKPPKTLLQFIAEKGGIADYKGELASMDAHHFRLKTAPGQRQKIVNPDGRTLDEMTEMAIEAGYFGIDDPSRPQKFGINELLDLIDTEMRGQPVYSISDTENANLRAGIDAREADIEAAASRFEEIVSMAGPGLPDETIRRIDQLMLEGAEMEDAIEQAIMELPEPDGRSAGEALPGWSDEELLAASRDAPPITDEIFEGAEPHTVRQADGNEADDVLAQLQAAAAAMPQQMRRQPAAAADARPVFAVGDRVRSGPMNAPVRDVNEAPAFRDMTPDRAAEFIREDLANAEETRFAGNMFFAEDRDLALGQNGNTGAVIEIRPNAAAIEARGQGFKAAEFQAMALKRNAVTSIKFADAAAIENFMKRMSPGWQDRFAQEFTAGENGLTFRRVDEQPAPARAAANEADELPNFDEDFLMPDPATGEARLASEVFADANRDAEFASILEACRT